MSLGSRHVSTFLGHLGLTNTNSSLGLLMVVDMDKTLLHTVPLTLGFSVPRRRWLSLLQKCGTMVKSLYTFPRTMAKITQTSTLSNNGVISLRWFGLPPVLLVVLLNFVNPWTSGQTSLHGTPSATIILQEIWAVNMVSTSSHHSTTPPSVSPILKAIDLT